jgi:hypothetical protein
MKLRGTGCELPGGAGVGKEVKSRTGDLWTGDMENYYSGSGNYFNFNN